MPNTYTASDFLRAFETAYGAMDVRIALIRHQDEWLLTAASAHIRVASPEAAGKEFTDLEKHFGKIDSPTFRIFQKCYPMAEVEQFFNHIAKGQLVVDDVTITLTDPVDMLSRHGSAKNNDFHNDGGRWPCIASQHFIARNDGLNSLLFNDGEISRAAENAGYKDSHTAAGTLLDVDFSNSHLPGGLWVTCDIPVRLFRPVVSKIGNNLQLTLRAETGVGVDDLSCNLHWTTPYPSNRSGYAKAIFAKPSVDQNKAFWFGEVSVGLGRGDSITIDIVSNKTGKLYGINARPFDFLPPEQRNPLLATLQLFCSPDQISLLLSEPHKATVGSSNETKAQKLFEVSIQWLLSIVGFYSVCLQGYEKFKEPGMEHGTLDCLAYSEDEDLLLLTHCTIGAPNPNEIGKYANLAARISDLLFSDGKVSVRSALFTASYKPNAAQQKAYGSAVKIFYRDDIEQLLQTAKSGQKFDYLRRLMLPRFSD